MTPPVEWPESVVEAAARAHHDCEQSARAPSDRVDWDAGLRPVQQQARLHKARAALSCPAVQQHIAALLDQARREGEAAMRERAARECDRAAKQSPKLEPDLERIERQQSEANHWLRYGRRQFAELCAQNIRALPIITNEGDN